MSFIKSIRALTKLEKIIWITSLLVIFASSTFFPNPDWLSVITSIIGATALIFVGKGDPIGQLITIIFAVFYGAVSLKFRYYGEMITYLGMTAPSALWALITWLKNPFTERQVKVGKMSALKWLALIVSALLTTAIMGFILAYFNTPNLVVSIVSVTTSFVASMLTILRSPYYALFYALNDIVLITLWILATTVNIGYLPMVICFVIFLVYDIYGFINWHSIKQKQAEQ